MSLEDFVAQHPVPQPPEPEVQRDPALEAFSDARRHAAGMPFGGRNSMQIVDRSVCRFDPRNPCGHDHAGPIFRPEPELDEVGVGWTVQHTPTDFHRHEVPMHCVVCGSAHDDLRDHECQVMAVLNG